MDELKLIHETLIQLVGEMCEIHTDSTIYEDCYVLEVTPDTVLVEAYSEVKNGLREFLIPLETIRGLDH